MTRVYFHPHNFESPSQADMWIDNRPHDLPSMMVPNVGDYFMVSNGKTGAGGEVTLRYFQYEQLEDKSTLTIKIAFTPASPNTEDE